MIKKIFSALAAVVFLCACGEPIAQNEIHNKVVYAMDTAMVLRAYGAESAAAALDECEQTINALDELFSATNAQSDIAKLNAANGEYVELGDETIRVLRLCLQYAEATGGAFDPTVYSAVKLWGFTTGENHVPGEQEIAQALKTVGYEKIEIDGNRVRLLDGAQIDFGAIAKGYLAARLCNQLGGKVDSAVLTLGGNVQGFGVKPNGEDWVVGIVNPQRPDDSVVSLLLENMAVVTSGNYQRYFEGENGERYHHIIDPQTGFPVQNGLDSVTVITPDGAMADAYSTALFVMGEQEGLAFWREAGGFEVLFITADNRVVATGGLREKITLLNDSFTLEYVD